MPNTIKVCFLSWHYKTPSLFLDTLLKMTPGRSGTWKNIVAVTDPFEADFCCVFDGWNEPMPHERVIYFGQHPYISKELSPSFRRWEDKKALLKLPLDKFPNAGEWWISHDYDTLSALTNPNKDKKAACIITYQTHNSMYMQRPKFMSEYFKKYPDDNVDLFGRPADKFLIDDVLKWHYRGVLGKNNPDGTLGEHLLGKERLINYRYTIEFDVGPTKNYFSERFYDSLLLWCMPIYFGSDNVHTWIPEKSFRYFDANRFLDVNHIHDIVNSDCREENINAIAEARELLLNKWQTWAYVHDVVNNVESYRTRGL